MNITQNYNYQPNYQQNKINFKAIPRASYKLFKETGDALVYQLEKKDIPVLENIRANLQAFFEKHNIVNDATQEIIEKALKGSVDFLKAEKYPQKKAKVLMAVAEGEPCGLLVGNGLKIDKKSGKLVYSSRRNRGKKETEIDFLSNWDNNTRKGTGAALIDEYFITAKEDGFKSVFVRSEIPKYTDAESFYAKNGCERLTRLPKSDLRKGDADYVTGEYFDPNDKILPMKASASKMDATIEETSRIMQRNENISHESVNLSEVLNPIEPSTVK